MGFEIIIDGIRRLEREDFTFDSIKFAGVIEHKLNNIVVTELLSHKYYAKENYQILHNHLRDVLYTKMKDALDFDDEVIEKMVDLIKYSNRLEDIYVFDGNVIAKVLSTDGFEVKDVTHLYPTAGFRELTTLAFNDSFKELAVRDLIVAHLNNAIKPMIESNVYNVDPIASDGLEIGYTFQGIEVYLNRGLKEIDRIYNKNKRDVTKVLIKVDEENYYSYDLKCRDGYMILAQNDFTLKKVSEMLDSKKLKK